jgi:hypothetical protein
LRGIQVYPLNILNGLPIYNSELFEKGKPGKSRGRKTTSLRHYCYDSRVANGKDNNILLMVAHEQVFLWSFGTGATLFVTVTKEDIRSVK